MLCTLSKGVMPCHPAKSRSVASWRCESPMCVVCLLGLFLGRGVVLACGSDVLPPVEEVSSALENSSRISLPGTSSVASSAAINACFELARRKA